MFKRVEKRRRKKEEEEELGLDEDMKEVLGMQDTDSDESDSDSDSDSDSERGLGIGNEDDGSDAGDIEEEAEISADEGDEDAEENGAKTPELSVQDALDDPIYLVSLEPDIKACIACPTKLLKHPKMIEVHKASNAHKRRFTRFVELARHANPDDNAWDILQNDGATKVTSEKDSRRSEKRKAKLAAVKAKREAHREKKAKAKAKQKEKAAEAKAAAAAAASPSESTDKKAIEEPARKKRKLDQDGKSKRKQHQPSPSATKEHRAKGKIKFSAAGHKRGKVGGGKMDRAQKQGERKQKRRRDDDSALKIFD